MYRYMTTRAEKRTVYQRVQRAIATGRLTKQGCEDCGVLEGVQAHHENGYEPPNDLDIVWLCGQHHLARHGAIMVGEPMPRMTEWQRRPSLTLRERQVARLVTEGFSAREIGKELGIAIQTVKNHKQSIYTKLGARNAVELTRALVE